MRSLLLTILFLATTLCQAQQADCVLPWEAQLSYDVNTIPSATLRSISKGASASLIPISVAVPAGFYLAGILGASHSPSTNRYHAESGVQFATTVASTYVLTLVLKNVVGRERPYQAYPGCITAYNSDADGSWPSGHSAGSAALATSLCLRYPQWYVIAPSVAYALYMGFSRIHLGMHYLSDVVSGYALGAGVALGVHLLRNELFGLAEPFLPQANGGGTPYGLLVLPGQYTPIVNVSIPF